MTSQAKVLDFLDFGGTWDPSLAFVMGCGILVSGPAFLYAEREASKPLCSDCSYEKPPKHGNYPQLIFGASLFGLGWGLIGICPGPAIAGVVPYLVDGDGPGFSFGFSFLVICITWLITVAFLKQHCFGGRKQHVGRACAAALFSSFTTTRSSHEHSQPNLSRAMDGSRL